MEGVTVSHLLLLLSSWELLSCSELYYQFCCYYSTSSLSAEKRRNRVQLSCCSLGWLVCWIEVAWVVLQLACNHPGITVPTTAAWTSDHCWLESWPRMTSFVCLRTGSEITVPSFLSLLSRYFIHHCSSSSRL